MTSRIVLRRAACLMIVGAALVSAPGAVAPGLVFPGLVAFTRAAEGEIDPQAKETWPPELAVVALEARPDRVELTHRFDYRQLLVTGKLATGESVDLTRLVKFESTPKTVAITDTASIRPLADGEERLVARFGDLSAAVTVKVTGFGEHRPVSFVRDIQPAMSKMGCNAGTCHGSKDGKNGFKLSLRGYDPDFDYFALTDDVASRRFNRAAPEQSLMLLKTSGAVPHVGGVRTRPGELYYEMLREWISQGAQFDADAKRAVKIEIHPLDPIVPKIGLRQQMTVVATYPDGARRDVTREAHVESGNIEVLAADAQGVLTTLRQGEAPVLVRYEGSYAATIITVLGDRAGFVWQDPPTHGFIDEFVYKKLKRNKIPPSDVCSDDEFCRRVYLDLTGLPPTSAQARAFLADPRESRQKREALVDQLVGSGEYVEHWTNKWADLLQVNRKFLGEEGAVALRNWIKASVAENKPYNQFAHEVLTASGSNLDNPAAGYYKVLRDPAGAMENTTHLFMAVRFNCNKCHDHPFERWTQDQYYNLAAYFTQVGRKEDPSHAGQRIGGSAVEGAAPLVEIVFDTGGGEIKHDRTGAVAPPAFPFQHDDLLPANAARRAQVARWLTSPKNQYFAKSYVNRLWGYMFGVGIIEPIDDIRAGNPPTNPELLDALTAEFVSSGFNIQHMLRLICKSRAYQHSVKSNKLNHFDQINYSHALPRRLPAETLFDAIHLATGATPRLPNVPVGLRAAELPDAGVSLPFLDDFGRPVRESACECERGGGVVLGPVMKLVNGPDVSNALIDSRNAISKLVAEQPDDAKVVEELFLRFLGRYPTAQETALFVEQLRAVDTDAADALAALRAYEETLPARQAAWEAAAASEATWSALKPTDAQSAAGAKFQVADDGAISVSGPLAKDVYTLTFETTLAGITGLRLEALADKALPAGGPGRAQNGNFVLSEFQLAAAPKADPAKAAPQPFARAAADFSQDAWAAAGAVDGNEGTGWAVSPRFGADHWAVFELAKPLGDGPAVLTLRLSQQFPDGAHLLGKFRVAATTSKQPTGGASLPENIVTILKTPAAQRSAEQQTALRDHHRGQDAELARLSQAAARAQAQVKNPRLLAAQDLAWGLLNSSAFLFNR